MKRFDFTPFWQVTKWGFLGLRFGMRQYFGVSCDEWHNHSRFVVIPMVGMFVLFAKGSACQGEVHLYAYCDGIWDGLDVPGCDICAEIKKEN